MKNQEGGGFSRLGVLKFGFSPEWILMVIHFAPHWFSIYNWWHLIELFDPLAPCQQGTWQLVEYNNLQKALWNWCLLVNHIWTTAQLPVIVGQPSNRTASIWRQSSGDRYTLFPCIFGFQALYLWLNLQSPCGFSHALVFLTTSPTHLLTPCPALLSWLV